MFDYGLVSIIMPSYNSGEFIATTINSVLQQTYSNWELLITDDCSTDNTLEVVNGLIAKDARIKLFPMMENLGAAVARNNSISKAEGAFLAFLDSDDIWLPTKLAEQLKFMKETSAVFCFTGYSVFTGDGVFQDKVIDSKTPDSIGYIDLLKKSCTVGCSTVILDRGFFGEIKMKNIRTGQDYALWLQLLRVYNVRALNMKKRLGGYRIAQGSISRNKFKKAMRQWQIYTDIESIDFFHAFYYWCFYGYHAVFRK